MPTLIGRLTHDVTPPNSLVYTVFAVLELISPSSQRWPQPIAIYPEFPRCGHRRLDDFGGNRRQVQGSRPTTRCRKPISRNSWIASASCSGSPIGSARRPSAPEPPHCCRRSSRLSSGHGRLLRTPGRRGRVLHRISGLWCQSEFQASANCSRQTGIAVPWCQRGWEVRPRPRGGREERSRHRLPRSTRPAKSTRPSRNSGLIILIASSNRETRWSQGNPNMSYSGLCQPAPTPRTNRPPLISSIISDILATIAGLRQPRHVTWTPSVMRDVTAAIPAMSGKTSQTPRVAPSPGGICMMKWSGNHSPS